MCFVCIGAGDQKAADIPKEAADIPKEAVAGPAPAGPAPAKRRKVLNCRIARIAVVFCFWLHIYSLLITYSP